MRLLILGGTGFLGSAFAKRIQREGHDVKVYSLSAVQTPWAGVEGISGSINDIDNLRSLLAWAEQIYHFVSTTIPKTSDQDPTFDVNTNLVPWVALLEELRTLSPRKIIFCSSSAVYGENNGELLTEDRAKRPIHSYGMVKSMMEDYLIQCGTKYATPYLIVRPSNVFGSKLKSVGSQGLISTLLVNALAGKPTTLWANPEVKKDYIYIDDVVDAMMSLLHEEGIFNIASGDALTIKQVVKEVEECLQRPVSVVLADQLLREEPCLPDTHKLKQVTKWSPRHSFQQGLLELRDVISGGR